MTASSDMDGIYVGLMSGTSLDGISAAVVRFMADRRVAEEPATESEDGSAVPESRARLDFITHDLIAFETIPYSESQRARLRAALAGASPEEYCRLNADLGEWLADAASRVIASSRVSSHDVRAIASHGQTIWHVPAHSTWQTGESAVIAERLGIDVVSDFRVRDVAAGGHGAPLVPIADALLYSHPEEWRILQNIGGIANVTVVPPGGSLDGMRAFDTGPGMMIVDAVVQTLYPGQLFDTDGHITARGTVHHQIVAQLLDDTYFRAAPPKSTGRELFDARYAQRLIDLVHANGGSDADVVATAVSLTAESIVDAYARFITEPVADVVVSGGGARHPAVIAALRQRLAPLAVHRFRRAFLRRGSERSRRVCLIGLSASRSASRQCYRSHRRTRSASFGEADSGIGSGPASISIAVNRATTTVMLSCPPRVLGALDQSLAYHARIRLRQRDTCHVVRRHMVGKPVATKNEHVARLGHLTIHIRYDHGL